MFRMIFVAWHGLWWNIHVTLARYHDQELQRVDPEWRDKI